MGSRVLSREEWESLSPEAVQLVYKYIYGQFCSTDIMEKTLLQALVVSRINQCQVDADTLSFLIEKISEYEGSAIFDPDEDEMNAAYRYQR